MPFRPRRATEESRYATLLLAPVGQPTNLGRLHDETNRGRSAGIDDDDPPVADKSVDEPPSGTGLRFESALTWMSL
jgi:hypothetical protein